LPNRYPKINQSHGTLLYKGLSLSYPKLIKNYLNTKRIERKQKRSLIANISMVGSGIFVFFNTMKVKFQ